MADDLDAELAALEAPAVDCRVCGHAYPAHDAGGGHCAAAVGGWSSPAHALPCPCPGFRWVDPAGPAVGSYTDPPARG